MEYLLSGRDMTSATDTICINNRAEIFPDETNATYLLNYGGYEKGFDTLTFFDNSDESGLDTVIQAARELLITEYSE